MQKKRKSRDEMINLLSFLFYNVILYSICNGFFLYDLSDILKLKVYIVVFANNNSRKKITHHFAAVVYNTCQNPWYVRLEKFGIPYYHAECSNKTHNVDCYEAIPYLRFIYQNYDNLTGKIFFIHGHEKSWHYRGSVFGVINEKMRRQDFLNLTYEGLYRTMWHFDIPWKVKDNDGRIYDELFRQIYKGTSMMKYYDVEKMSFPCCGTFVVDAETGFKRRTRDEYMTFIKRLTNYSLHVPNASYYCGRLLEFTWHLMLSDNPFIFMRNVV